jgi:hypothetical protein
MGSNKEERETALYKPEYYRVGYDAHYGAKRIFVSDTRGDAPLYFLSP